MTLTWRDRVLDFHAVIVVEWSRHERWAEGGGAVVRRGAWWQLMCGCIDELSDGGKRRYISNCGVVLLCSPSLAGEP